MDDEEEVYMLWSEKEKEWIEKEEEEWSVEQEQEKE